MTKIFSSPPRLRALFQPSPLPLHLFPFLLVRKFIFAWDKVKFYSKKQELQNFPVLCPYTLEYIREKDMKNANVLLESNFIIERTGNRKLETICQLSFLFLLLTCSKLLFAKIQTKMLLFRQTISFILPCCVFFFVTYTSNYIFYDYHSGCSFIIVGTISWILNCALFIRLSICFCVIYFVQKKYHHAATSEC